MTQEVTMPLALPLEWVTRNHGLQPFLNQVLEADCLDVLARLPDNSIDLIVTSPPYADNRKRTYDGVPVNRYVEWFLPIAEELRRVLKPDGSFILNIKERTVAGERGTYVLELILAMRQQGWLWTEEYVWHKKNCYPGKWPNRFRDAWERCLHFTKQKRFKMFQEAVMVPTGNWAEKRLANLSMTDRVRDESRVASGFGKRVANWLGRDRAYPTNVLHLATECSNRGHSASFPEALPNWFIRLFTRPGDVVLDPFLGAGTTALACIGLQRDYVGIDKNPAFVKMARAAIQERLAARRTRMVSNGYRRTRASDRALPGGLLQAAAAGAREDSTPVLSKA